MSTIKERLYKLAESYNLSVRAFEEKCNLGRGNISNMSHNGAIGSDKLSKIFDAFPDIDINWILTGNSTSTIHEPSRNTQTDSLIDTRPRIPIDASAGSLSIILESITEFQCERLPIIPRFPKYDFTIQVNGDSMEPEFLSGDEIACRFINEKSFIQWGKPHVLDTTQGVVLKRIFERNKTILCRSDNPAYDDFEIPKEDILRIALVVGNVRVY